jgi:hypothetical protein
MAPPAAKLTTVQLWSSLMHASSLTRLNMPLKRLRQHPGSLGAQDSPVSLKQYSLLALRSRAHSFSLPTAHFLEPRKGPYICNFPLYTQLTFLILATSQRAILYPGFSTLPPHHSASQFLNSPNSALWLPLSQISLFNILQPFCNLDHAFSYGE